MRNVFAFFIGSVLMMSPALALAQETSGTDVPAAAPQATALPGKTLAEKRAARLDELFFALKRERNEAKATRIAEQIQAQWQNSGSATVDLMMQWAALAMTEKKYAVALDFLDQVTVMKPDFAEGWNRRATVNFLMNDYGRSMADIQKTLSLEPRHFGALAGLAAILKDTGNKEGALHAFEQVLAVYPMMREAQKQAGQLAEDLTGQRT
ncbi:tetratricopeptide repeat protein [Phyllobacterium calauticae]|jgi:tetratricopeptide (TPR) repeat protein